VVLGWDQQEVTRRDMAVNKNYKGKVNRLLVPERHGLSVPGICYLCGGPLKCDELLVCTACINDLPVNVPACPHCALPVMNTGMSCGNCLSASRRITRGFFAPFLYTFPVDRLIHDLKYHARIEVAGFLGRWMAQVAVASGLSMPQCLVPVPLHRSRIAERGYNQSLEIARAAGSMLDIPVCYGLCGRTVNTPPQSTSSFTERERNLKGAFAVARHPRRLPGHVTIVDDVITTGATVNELARVLDRYGVTRIDVWAAARTVLAGL
jgi:ComF family protein